MPYNYTVPTVADLELMFTSREILELSNLDDPSAITINAARVQLAIDDANEYFNNLLTVAPTGAVAVICASSKRTIAIIARYFLDSFRTRTYITEDFERITKTIDQQVNAYRYARGFNAIRFNSARGTHNPIGRQTNYPVDNNDFV